MKIESAYKIMFTEYKDVVTLSELSSMLGVSKKTAVKILEQGEIPYMKAGREYRIPKINVIRFYLNNAISN